MRDDKLRAIGLALDDIGKSGLAELERRQELREVVELEVGVEDEPKSALVVVDGRGIG